MSLAIYAAPFNNDSNNDSSTNTPTGQKWNQRRNANNRTQKRVSKQDYDSNKVNSVLNAIHNNSNQNDDTLGDYKPLAPPVSVGVENTKLNEEKQVNTHNDDDDIDLHALKSNYMNEQAMDQYYKQFIPNYKMAQAMSSHVSPQEYVSHNASQNGSQNGSNDPLMTKLNYMIHLLEEQQDEKTNNVTEEVILYSFLGIFMIFIVDSFVKVGKYVR